MVVGIDSHKETVAACVVDELGGELATAIFPNTGAGHDSLLSWARSRGEVSLFGIEGSGGVGYALARRLATLGEGVVEVPPFLTVRERKHLRQRGKSDPADALAIARVVAREADLPRFLIHDRARQLGQILNYRDQLVGYQAEIKNLVSRRSLRRVQALIEAGASIETALLLRRLSSLRLLSSEIADLNVHINRLVEQSRTGLIDITGVGALVAARILAEVGDVQRIASESRFAALNGTAPVPASSGTIQRHRLNRGGNRRLNRALHTIAVIQAHLDPRARAYLQRRRAEGKTQREAIRCLKRQLSNVVYRQLVADRGRLR